MAIRAVTRTDLLVGTRKGLFRASRRGGGRWELEGPWIAGHEVYHVRFDPRDGRTGWAAARHEVWGAHLFRTGDRGESWETLPGRPSFPEASGRRVTAIWHLAGGTGGEATSGGPSLYAGVEPAALFRSRDGGESWRWLRSLEDHPTRSAWQPARGGLALHSIQIDPRRPRRIYVAISAGGCYRSEDGGESWRALNRGVRADFLPTRYPEAGQCVHSLRIHPARPDRLYQQNHCGTYRSDDRGENWTEITPGLPSDFGYVIRLDPSDPDRCWVIPEESSHMRSVCDGRLRLFETTDAGESWEPRTRGLPQQRAYVSVLREALATAEPGPELYFGTSSGHLFAGAGGMEWRQVASFLPKILCVTALRG